MDTPMLIALIALAAIALIEIVCLFLCRNSSERTPLTVAVPVFKNKDLLDASLERVRELMLRGYCTVDRIILIDYGADEASVNTCNEFCRDFQEAVFISPYEIEKILAETFAFTERM